MAMNIFEEQKAQAAAIAALPEVARLIEDIKYMQAGRRAFDLPSDIGSKIIVLDLHLDSAVAAAYNLGWEQRGDAEFEQGRISKEEERCGVPGRP